MVDRRTCLANLSATQKRCLFLCFMMQLLIAAILECQRMVHARAETSNLECLSASAAIADTVLSVHKHVFAKLMEPGLELHPCATVSHAVNKSSLSSIAVLLLSCLEKTNHSIAQSWRSYGCVDGRGEVLFADAGGSNSEKGSCYGT